MTTNASKPFTPNIELWASHVILEILGALGCFRVLGAGSRRVRDAGRVRFSLQAAGGYRAAEKSSWGRPRLVFFCFLHHFPRLLYASSLFFAWVF